MKITTATFLIVFFLFRVVSAEPIAPDPNVNKALGGEIDPPQSTTPLKPMDVTLSSPPQSASQSFFYPFGQNISVNFGLMSINASDGTFPFYGSYGLSYLWNSIRAFHIESGFEATTLGEGHLWAAGRWICHFTDAFRPYYSIGLGLRIRPDRALANAVDIGNYFLRGAGGFEYTLVGQYSWRSEIYIGADAQGHFFAGPTIGLSLGF